VINRYQAQAPDLAQEVRHWLARNPAWYLRDRAVSEDYGVDAYWISTSRYATSSEIAADIVNDPGLRDALGFLASPPGQTVEQAVAQLWLPPITAQLLTAALTEAWKIVLNANRPVWQRAEVLAAAALLLTIVSLAIWANRTTT
jgi:hypothetical protein